MHKHLADSRGLGLIEVVVAGTVLLIVSIGIGLYFTNSRTTLNKLSTSASCENTAQNLMGLIKSMDNSQQVRNWLPFGKVVPPDSPRDRLCPGDASASCDRSLLPTNPVATTRDGDLLTNTFLNIRGATSWAFNIFVLEKPKIHEGHGIKINDVPKYFPGYANEAGDSKQIELFIDKKSDEGFVVKVRVEMNGSSCEATHTFLLPNGGSTPVLSYDKIYTRSEEFLTEGFNICTCVPPEHESNNCRYPNGISIDEISIDQPGSTLFCRTEGPAFPNGGSKKWVYCGFVAQVKPTVFSFDGTPQGVSLEFLPLETSGTTVNKFEIQVFSPSGQRSGILSRTFTVNAPECPESRECEEELIDKCGYVCPPILCPKDKPKIKKAVIAPQTPPKKDTSKECKPSCSVIEMNKVCLGKKFPSPNCEYVDCVGSRRDHGFLCEVPVYSCNGPGKLNQRHLCADCCSGSKYVPADLCGDESSITIGYCN